MLLLFRSEETRVSEIETGDSGELTRSKIGTRPVSLGSLRRGGFCRVGSSFAKLDGDVPSGGTEGGGDQGEKVTRSSCVFAAGGACNYPK